MTTPRKYTRRSEPTVTLKLTKAELENYHDALSKIGYWARGFNCASNAKDTVPYNGPPGLMLLSRLSDVLYSAMSRVEK